MKNNKLFSFATLIAIFFSLQVSSQTKISFNSLTMDIKGNIILLGIQHSDSAFEGQKSAFISNSSGDFLCSVYPKIIAAAGSKPVIYLMEGISPSDWIILDSAYHRELMFPDCLLEEKMLGCDTRPDSIKNLSLAVLELFGSIYDDGLNGKEETIEEVLGKYSTLDLSRLKLNDAKAVGIYNRNFENNILWTARDLEKKGFYVIVICGAAHVAKIIVEEEKKDIGYVFCQNHEQMKSALRCAKIFSVLEFLAYR